MFMEETYFWQDYLFQLERFGQEWKKVYEVFEEALGYTETAESASALYRTIIYAKLRYIKIDSIGKDTVDYLPVGEIFENAYNFLSEEYGQYWDENRNFTKNYAYFAFYRLNNVELVSFIFWILYSNTFYVFFRVENFGKKFWVLELQINQNGGLKQQIWNDDLVL